MERLTTHFMGQYRLKRGYELDTLQGARAVVDRLAAYEDTGLEPEEIRDLCADDVVEIARMFHRMIESGEIGHLCELLQAEQDGLLVVLPCKIGTDVYAVYTSVRGTNPTVFKVGFGYGLIPHWGKAVFATREEAKAALEAYKGGAEE